MSPKITLPADRLYLIREIKTKPDGKKEIRYYESPSVWTTSPMLATLFQDYENGVRHLNMYDARDKAPKGWADGSTSVFDVVPLYGEIIMSPNGMSFTLKNRDD